MYKATVVKLPEPSEHPNADRLQIFTILGYQVITSLEYTEGMLGLFFPPDGQVSERFAKVNDLIGYTDEDGNRKGGFMTDKRRVKAINLRGEKSQGLWLPLMSLALTVTGIGDPQLVFKLQEGDELDTLDGHQFCQKYFTPATRNAMKSKGNKVSRKETPMFRRHIDTDKLQQKIGYFPLGFPIIITEKVHGTSGRYGRVLDPVEYPWWHYKRYMGEMKQEWRYLSGTRNVIHRSDADVKGGFYDDNSFRMKAVEPLVGNLHKGEVVYFEIVGWEGVDRPIMPSVDTNILRDKDIKKAYGDKMFYKYGVPNGECKLLVYRIVMTNEDGVGYDLTWDQVVRRCGELGVEPVREISRGMPKDFGNELQDLRESILNSAEYYASGPSTYDHTHIREGCVLRVDTGNPTPEIFKYKSHEFLVLEGHLKGREDYIDMEEIS